MGLSNAAGLKEGGLVDLDVIGEEDLPGGINLFIKTFSSSVSSPDSNLMPHSATAQDLK